MVVDLSLYIYIYMYTYIYMIVNIISIGFTLLHSQYKSNETY